MIIQRDMKRGVRILVPFGSVTSLGGVTELSRAVLGEELISEQKYFLLNLGQITDLDSAGVGIVLSFFMRAKDQGKVVKFCGLPRKVREKFILFRLMSELPIYDDEVTALASFPQDQSSRVAS